MRSTFIIYEHQIRREQYTLYRSPNRYPPLITMVNDIIYRRIGQLGTYILCVSYIAHDDEKSRVATSLEAIRIRTI